MEQDYIICQVAHNIKLLYKQYSGNKRYNTKHANMERDTLNSIKRKLSSNKAAVLKADKGNTVVITYLDDYHLKVHEFISNNQFSEVNSDLTSTFQKEIKNTINDSVQTIHRDEKWKYVNLNPSAPTMTGLLKIHKLNSPKRPVINWQNAPVYKLAKLLSKLLQFYIPLPSTSNTQNSVHLINDIVGIPLNQNLWFVSFDIEKKFFNVPTNNLINIVKLMCSQQNHDEKLKKELIKMTRTILKNKSTLNSRTASMFKIMDLQWRPPPLKFFPKFIYSTSNTQQYMKC